MSCSRSDLTRALLSPSPRTGAGGLAQAATRPAPVPASSSSSGCRNAGSAGCVALRAVRPIPSACVPRGPLHRIRACQMSKTLAISVTSPTSMVFGQSWGGGDQWVGFAEQTWRTSAGVGFGVGYQTSSPGHQEWPGVSQHTVLTFNPNLLELEGIQAHGPSKARVKVEGGARQKQCLKCVTPSVS